MRKRREPPRAVVLKRWERRLWSKQRRNLHRKGLPTSGQPVKRPPPTVGFGLFANPFATEARLP